MYKKITGSRLCSPASKYRAYERYIRYCQIPFCRKVRSTMFNSLVYKHKQLFENSKSYITTNYIRNAEVRIESIPN